MYTRGICGVTTFVGGRAQCTQSQLSTAKGALAAVSLRECLRACETCNACAFVSFSRKLEECSWFAECSLDDVFLMNQSHSKQAVSFETWDARLLPKRRAARQRSGRPGDLVPDLTFLDEACGNGPRKTSIFKRWNGYPDDENESREGFTHPKGELPCRVPAQPCHVSSA